MVGQISGEIIYTIGKQPDSSILDVDVGEDWCPGEIGFVCLRCLVHVGSKRTNVNQAGNAFVGPCACDYASAVRVTNKDNWTINPADGRSDPNGKRIDNGSGAPNRNK